MSLNDGKLREHCYWLTTKPRSSSRWNFMDALSQCTAEGGTLAPAIDEMQLAFIRETLTVIFQYGFYITIFLKIYWGFSKTIFFLIERGSKTWFFLERFNILQINTKLSLVIHTLSKGEVFFSFSINKLLFFSLKIHTFGIRNDHYYEKRRRTFKNTKLIW